MGGGSACKHLNHQLLLVSSLSFSLQWLWMDWLKQLVYFPSTSALGMYG